DAKPQVHEQRERDEDRTRHAKRCEREHACGPGRRSERQRQRVTAPRLRLLGAHWTTLRARRFGVDSRLGRPCALVWITLRAARFGTDSRLGRPCALVWITLRAARFGTDSRLGRPCA